MKMINGYMERSDLLFFRKWFRKYVSNFYSDDSFIMQNIRLKEDHSWRVCSNSIKISNSKGLSASDRYLAETIAIFHDIGRFEQFSRYGTFKDSESEDHAFLGVKILTSEDILSLMASDEQKVVYFAVENHNKFSISAINDERSVLHSKIIRDADKLDIFKVFIDEFQFRESNPNPALYMGFPDDPGYSGSIIEDIFNNTLSSIENVKNQNDLNLIRLTWLYDLNFTESFRLVEKRKYIERIMETLPQNAEMMSVRAHLEEYRDMMLG
ncbi:HD domain-containing protein [Methanolobus sp. ZRKC3]|uniref:HD domain-containing protein n=1 Tax=Methanolobus sp. ZRKC3 TaxID=3125786 RepID=UPI00324F6267